MIKIFSQFVLCICCFSANCQDFNGQWKGEFIDKSSPLNEKCEYVLELETNGTNAFGTSYTYFTDQGKRFYTICKVEGVIDFKKKYLEIKETERTKTNIPANIPNCLQTHKLTYFKKGMEETLEGIWIPAPNQKSNCGKGTTLLSKRKLINAYSFNKNKATIDIKKDPVTTKDKIAKNEPKPKLKNKKNQEQSNFDWDDNDLTFDGDQDTHEKTSQISPNETEELNRIEARKNVLIKTIEVESNTIRVDIYDNGEVDGDSVSLVYNGKLILSKRRLNTTPIKLNLKVDQDKEVNELTMYAENLGTYPPNTALMIITDGPNRYEVRISSDLEKSGVIKFIPKKN